MKVYGVWCKDKNGNKGDWLRELPSNVDDGGIAARAAKHYGFDSYSEVKKNDWCEVRPLSD